VFCRYLYQLRCQQNESFWDEIDRSWNITGHNNTINPNITYKNDEFKDLNVTLIIHATDEVHKMFTFLAVYYTAYYSSRDFVY